MTNDMVKHAEEMKSNKVELSPENSERMMHELQTHQFQLELLIQKALETQSELDVMRMRYFELYDLAPLGYCTLNAEGIIQEANLTSANMFGVNRNELVMKPFTRFIFNQDQDSFYILRKHLAGAKEPDTCELRMVKNDGTYFWVNLLASCKKDRQGALLYIVVLSNITDRINTENKAQELLDKNSKSYEQYINMLATTGDGFLLVGETGRIKDSNEKYIMLSGYSREELLNMSISDLEAKETPQQTQEHIAKTIRQSHDFFETQHRTKNGLLIDLEVSVTYQKSTREFLIFFRDISERKKILQQETEARIHAEATLARALKAERNLLKVCEETHQRIGQELHDDVGQQITAVAFLCEVLSRDLIKEDSAFVKDVQKITMRLNQAVSRVRQLSHGLCLINNNSHDLIGLLKSLADETAGIHGVDCNFYYDSEFCASDYFDYGDMTADELNIQLFRIAQEAVNNAIKHSRASQIDLFLKHRTKGDVLEITDNGIGMSAENANSGLGMYSMASRAKILNADIAFKTNDMGGLKVLVSMPKVIVSKTAKNRQSSV